ncbi:NERD domain-containing protein [Planococcus lenghuensis]|uniref:NERD domain-containing protein n=1 Tax=Planococcus lenghuensis TaxID=2213202 RepID=A0A1Q2L1G0_9BACL|nr:NERD domain-containing protein [Planococcus lenghuensis]AQQ54253.1 hypothetical protein B0X71_14875 [Planococcus lenghuensis]
MIIKYRTPPKKLAAYEALLRRLPEQHPEWGRIMEGLESVRAGFGGEVHFDGIMDHFSPAYAHVVLRDLALPGPYWCQADTLVITRSCIFLLEVKNMQGKLYFKSNPAALHQVKSDGTLKIHDCPVIQVRTTMLKIERFMRNAGILLPVIPLIVVAYPSQVVEQPPADMRLLAAREVNYHLSKMDLGKALISEADMLTLGRLLVSAHRDYDPSPVIRTFKIHPDDVTVGVCCSNCGRFSMEYAARRWKCGSCHAYSTDAHYQAIDDWFMLLKTDISTRECQQFLGVKRADVAKRMLKSFDLAESGSKKYRRYAKKH